MAKSNPKAGDFLRCVGGPLHNQKRQVTELFPFAPDLLSAAFTYKGKLYMRHGNVWRHTPCERGGKGVKRGK